MGLQLDICDPAMGGENMRVVELPARLSSQQKAAVIVRLLLSQNVSPALDRLTPEMQADLARALASLGPISRVTLAEVVREFTARLDGLALTTPNTLADAIALLEPHISPTARDGLRAEAEAGDPTDPWTRLAAMETDRLRPLLMSESAEVAAILLSKLGVAKAAALLAGLPEARAQVIAHAVSLTATVTPAMVERIGAHLVEQLDSVSESAFRASPVDRIGAILNSVNGALREALLGGLEARDKGFAIEVRRAIFTFQHIPKRVEPADVPRILRRVDPDVVTRAIAAGIEQAPLSVEFLLENMSKRLAEQIRDDAGSLPTLRPDEGEAAMAEVVTAIRALEEEGEIRLIPPED
ncbi:FliG C-terminal domain-containing protein [Roseicyclus mahoneyensis]|uniref:Flagellar motor switch protein FliG n=1 Tax=Roseicyclus mahoneyensis TaxID=164332 RepID=A0A316GNP1_9RHOB|nr:FliG C-terminal domain-containing protein [Roseicyclus mahoneyensis]PWK62777.1 flagellar motor switch protein FliG [Roseicyclus mahoneyensis]